MDELLLNKLNKHFSECVIKTYSKGQTITLANQDPEGVSLLQDGIVEQYDITPEGNKITVNIFKPPAFFPMSWAINHTPNTYFYSALTDVELRQADASETVTFLRNNPDLMFDLLSRVYKGTDALLRRLVLAASGIAASRLIFELLIETYRFGVEVSEGEMMVKVKQSALADRSGLARETVSRELQKLEDADYVSRNKQGMIINIKRLEEKLEFNI